MSVHLAYEKWLQYWDGVPAHYWRVEHETNLVRREVQIRLKKLGHPDAPGGYVLRGPYGTGKRELVRAAFQHLDQGNEPIWISGSHYGYQKPYGAMQFLLTNIPDGNGMDSPLAVFGYLKDRLGTFGARPLIILEHITLIDPLTTAVLCQLVSNGLIKMIVVDDLTESLSDDLSTLVRSGLMQIFQLNELSLAEARTQISMMLDHNVSYLTANRLWAHTAGSSEVLRAVVLDCRDAGLFTFKGESAALCSGSIQVGENMRNYTASRLDRLSQAQRDLLQSVAVEMALPEGDQAQSQESDIDILFARGLLAYDEGVWQIANPAIAQTLRRMYLDLTGWEHDASQLHALNEKIDVAAGPQLKNQSTSCQRSSAETWLNTQQTVQKHVHSGANDLAILTLKEFLAHEAESNEAFSVESGDARLRLLGLLLDASRLSEAAELIHSLQPGDSHGLWVQLDLCQQYQALSLLTEYLSRINDHEQARVLLDALLQQMMAQGRQITEYRISSCMAPSLRALINSTISLGLWEHCRRLIQLVLAGSLDDPSLIGYAESVHAVLLAIAGNYADAQKIIEPLQLQILQGENTLQRIFVNSVDAYIADRTGREHSNESMKRSAEDWTFVPLLGLQCLWQTMGFITGHHDVIAASKYAHVTQLAQWAEERGEALIASHLWATVIRHDGFDLAKRLHNLQEGHDHELAKAFRLLSQGAEQQDAQLLSSAMGALAALGFVAFATDDGAQIFRYLNPAQRRQASRKANSFMLSLQPDLIHPDAHRGLGRLKVLTDREKFVASAAASGLSNLEIAEQASVSVRTVEGHLYQVYSKLGISKRGDLSSLTGSRSEMDSAR